MKNKYKLLLSTVPNIDEARKLADNLLKKKYIACANIIPGLESFYWWQGKIESAQEVMLLMKTVELLVPRTISSIKSLHSYEVPEIVVITIEDGLPEYLKWITGSVNEMKKE